jgi:serine/threonine protein phosphatase PrpC
VSLTLRYGARTERGPVRADNQDSAYVAARLVAIADGMGGMAAGDLASRLVIGAMAAVDGNSHDGNAHDGRGNVGEALVGRLRAAASEGNRLIAAEVAENPGLRGMGTTLTALLVAEDKIGMVHVGDSRAYRLRDGELNQITKDDTYVQVLVDEGCITREEAATHPQRSAVTRALQGNPVEPRYSVRPAVAGDRYLLCSDGVSDFLDPGTIAAKLGGYAEPQAAADHLVAAALEAGATDNVTAIVADVVAGDASDADGQILGAAAVKAAGSPG